MNLGVINISYFKKNSKFGNIELDAVLEQEITLNNVISSKPYEDGEIVADGIHNLPLQISITGIVSDLPQTLVEQAKQLIKTDISGIFNSKNIKNSKSFRAWADLFALWQSKQLLQITTPFQSEPLDNMCIKSIKIQSEDEESITFSAELEQFLITSNLKKFNFSEEIGKQSER